MESNWLKRIAGISLSAASIVVFNSVPGRAQTASTFAQPRDAGALAEIAAARKIYDEQGPRAALPEYQRLLAEFQKSNDRHSEAITFGLIANCYRRFDQLSKAMEYARRGLDLKKELGDVTEQGRSYSQLGLIYWEMADYRRAIDSFQLAIQIGVQVDDRELEAGALNNLGLVEGDKGDYSASTDHHQRALELARTINFERAETDALANLGGIKLLLGRFAEAIPYYEDAFKIDEERGLRPSESADLGNLAMCQSALGNTDEALATFDRALALAEGSKLTGEAADWHRGKGDALTKAGKYQAAFVEYQQAQHIYEASGLRRELSELLNSEGNVHLIVGDISSSERDFRRALGLSRRIHHPQGVILNQLALGEIEARRYQFVQAVATFEGVRQSAHRSGDLASEEEAFVQLARTNLQSGQGVAAAKYAESAIRIAREMRSPPAEAEALMTEADAFHEQGRFDDALTEYDAALEVQKSFADPELEWRLRFARGKSLAATGRLEEARSEFINSIKIIEAVRAELSTDRYRAGYLQDRYQVYVALVELLLKLGEPANAFTYSERLRSRSYFDQVAATGTSVAADSPDKAALRERIRQLRREIDDEWGEQDRHREKIETFSNELGAAERAYEDLLDRDNVLTGATPANAVDASVVERKLDGRSALLEYVVGSVHTNLLIVRNDGIFAVTVPISQSQLEARIELMRSLIRNPGSEDWRAPSAALRRLLIEPAERGGWLRGITKLYISPDDVLNYLPFAALTRTDQLRSRYLIQDYVIDYVPTAEAIVSPTQETSRSNLMAIAPGRTRLRWAQQEARAITQLFPSNSQLLDGRSATETRFKQEAGEFDVLHLATHGYLNRAAPLLSALELEPDAENDGRLEVYEVLQLRLHARLVTLSACETALESGYFSETPAGDEFVGLTRAFLSAGARSVVASLWEVDDRSTMDLMRRFYRKFGAVDTATALAGAQRDMARVGGRYSHPYYWGPFVAVGN